LYDATKTALAELDDVAPFIDWESNKLDILPELLSFVRYFAICAIPLEDWNKEGLTLTSKFRSGIFWVLTIAHGRATVSIGRKRRSRISIGFWKLVALGLTSKTCQILWVLFDLPYLGFVLINAFRFSTTSGYVGNT
jgi:hypothetical protein